MQFRQIIILAFALLLFLGSWACSQRPAPKAYKGRIIEISDSTLVRGSSDTIRFGKLHSGEIAVMHFRLQNSSTRPIAVTGVDKTCGCTSLEYPQQPLTPTSYEDCSLTFDSRGIRGWQLKVVDLKLSATDRKLRLWVEAHVE